MTTSTLQFSAVAVGNSEDREAWLARRREGVTATEVAKLVGGGIKTRKSILAEKRGEGKDFSNASMERGRRREPIIAEWVARRFNIEPNTALFAQAEGSPYLATPDGFGWNFDEELCVGEIKSTTQDWSTRIPRSYIDQVQWQLFVLGARRAAFVWERVDENDLPYELEPTVVWMERDEARIAELKDAADAFLAWVAAGAPDVDADIDEELDEALTQLARARAEMVDPAAREKAAEATIRRKIAEHGGGAWKVQGTDAAFSFTVATPTTSEVETTDLEALKAAHPRIWARFTTKQQVSSKASTRLTVTPHKKVEVAEGD